MAILRVDVTSSKPINHSHTYSKPEALFVSTYRPGQGYPLIGDQRTDKNLTGNDAHNGLRKYTQGRRVAPLKPQTDPENNVDGVTPLWDSKLTVDDYVGLFERDGGKQVPFYLQEKPLLRVTAVRRLAADEERFLKQLLNGSNGH